MGETYGGGERVQPQTMVELGVDGVDRVREGYEMTLVKDRLDQLSKP